MPHNHRGMPIAGNHQPYPRIRAALSNWASNFGTMNNSDETNAFADGVMKLATSPQPSLSESSQNPMGVSDRDAGRAIIGNMLKNRNS